MKQSLWKLRQSDLELPGKLAAALGIGPLAARLLAARGFRSAEDARAFLRPSLMHLHNPELLPGTSEAARLIRSAIENGEKTAIYGDYDVDGVTGTALILRCLRTAGGDADVYLPRRLGHGYGLQSDDIEKLAAAGTKLLITCDCGISSVEEINLARARGMRVIISDHHEPGDSIPDADAIVNPKVGDDYPFRDLSGVGVAFKMIWALFQSYSPSKKVSDAFRDALMSSLALVALGTVADVVPLLGENRVLASFGLPAIAGSADVGLKALLAVSGLVNCQIKAHHAGFRLGPRLNAAGRLSDPALALELLTTDSPKRAMEIASLLDRENRRRQELETRIFGEARERVLRSFDEENTYAIVEADESWHVGVIGLVASRIAAAFHRPAVLISLEGSHGRGSARSIPAFHLWQALRVCSGKLTQFGGHSHAAGLRLPRENIPAFATELNSYAASQLSPSDLVPTVEIDAETSLAELRLETVKELELLEPFGQGNPEPRLLVKGVEIAGTPRNMGTDGRHLSFHVRQQGQSLRAVAFSPPESVRTAAQPGRRCSIVFAPAINDWRGASNVELRVEDVREEDGS